MKETWEGLLGDVRAAMEAKDREIERLTKENAALKAGLRLPPVVPI